MTTLGDLSGYTPQHLINNIYKIGKGQNFLVNEVFNDGRQNAHITEAISLAATTINIRVLPVTGPDGSAVPMAHPEGTVDSVIPPQLRNSFTMSETVAKEPLIGDSSFAGAMTDLNSALSARIALNQRKWLLSLQLTKEKYAADVLADGIVTLRDVDNNERFSIDYGYITTASSDTANVQDALTGTDAWGSASSKPLDDLENLEKQIRDYSDYGGPLMVLAGLNVVQALRNHAKLTTLLDAKNMDVGHLTSTAKNNFVGQLGTFPIFKYSQSAIRSKGTTRDALWDQDTIAMIPSDRSIFEFHYGGIYETPDGTSAMRWLQTDMFSKVYLSQDPPAQILVLESRPCPILVDIKPIRVQKVLA